MIETMDELSRVLHYFHRSCLVNCVPISIAQFRSRSLSCSLVCRSSSLFRAKKAEAKVLTMRISVPRLSRLETPIYYYRRVYIRRNVVRPRVIAARNLVREVRRAGKGRELYRSLMELWRQNCDNALIHDLIHNMMELLKEHRRLLFMCNVLPENLEFQMPDDAESGIEQENN